MKYSNTTRSGHTPEPSNSPKRSKPLWVILVAVLAIAVLGARIYRYIAFELDKQNSRTKALEKMIVEDSTSETNKSKEDSTLSTEVKLYTDATSLTVAKEMWNTNCAVCHKADGGGGIGPNLTDDYWILGGGFENIYKVIAEGGRPGKGMVPWKTNFSPKEIALLTSYIISLNGTTPEDPIAPEGDVIWSKEM